MDFMKIAITEKQQDCQLEKQLLSAQVKNI